MTPKGAAGSARDRRSSPPLRVLIADDDPAFRLLARRELGRDTRFSVLPDAGDGAEAVSAAAREHPDVILMDVRMPVMDGVEATRRIREVSPDTSVVIVSSFFDLEPAEIGATARVDKSDFNYRRLLDALGIDREKTEAATGPAKPVVARTRLSRIVVTGGSGRLGQYLIPELMQHGYEVVNADRVPGDAADVRTVKIDVTNFGDVVAATSGADAIVHLAAIANPLDEPEHRVFATNMQSAWNVLEAAYIHHIPRVVMASSINAVGAVFSQTLVPPLYFPIDEEHPTRAEDAYSQSKWLGEELAMGFCRRREMQIASLRFHGLWDFARQRAHRGAPNSDPTGRPAKQFWGWVDRWDAARACRLALEQDWEGHEAFFINAADTTLTIPTEEALKQVYPDVPIKKPMPGYASAIDISKAGSVLGWRPQRTWRDG